MSTRKSFNAHYIWQPHRILDNGRSGCGAPSSIASSVLKSSWFWFPSCSCFIIYPSSIHKSLKVDHCSIEVCSVWAKRLQHLDDKVRGLQIDLLRLTSWSSADQRWVYFTMIAKSRCLNNVWKGCLLSETSAVSYQTLSCNVPFKPIDAVRHPSPADGDHPSSETSSWDFEPCYTHCNLFGMASLAIH